MLAKFMFGWVQLVMIWSFIAAPVGLADVSKCKDEAQYGEVSFEELSKLVQEKKVTLIDVNSRSSFAKNKIPGAIHFGTQEAQLKTLLPADKAALVVAYCGGPKCDAWVKGASAACEMGYTNIKHFKDGISGWVKKTKT